MKLRRFAGLKAYVKSHQGLTRPRGIPRLRAEVTLKLHELGDLDMAVNPSATCRGNVEAIRACCRQGRGDDGIPRLRAEVTLKLGEAIHSCRREESLGYVPR